MKKHIVLLLMAVLLFGCNCISQIPPQYAYMDSTCVGEMPNVLDKITSTDNCSFVTVVQVPSAGSPISEGTLEGLVRATDASGNITTVTFPVTVVDTISPKIYYNDTLIVSFDQASAMYKTFVAWIQQDIDRLNGFEEFRKLQVDGDSVQVWYNSIAIYSKL